MKHIRHVWFEVMQHCNERCAFCFNVWKEGATYPILRRDPARLEAVLDAVLGRLGPDTITFSGGEPLLCRDLEALVARSSRERMKIQVTTNGTLLTRDRARSLVGAGARVFAVTLLAGESAPHDALTGLPGSFRRAARGIAEARRAGARVGVVFVATAANLEHLTDAAEMGIALGATCLELVRFLPGGAGLARAREFSLTQAQMRRMLVEGERLARTYGIHVSCAEPVPAAVTEGLDLRRVRLSACGAGGVRLAVDAAGNVRPCEQDARILGSVLDPAFRIPEPRCLSRACAVEAHHGLAPRRAAS